MMSTSAERSAGAAALLALTGLLFRSWQAPPFGATTVSATTESLALGTRAPIERFQEYLRIRTDHPGPDYFGAVEYLDGVISELIPPATTWTVELVEGKPILLARVAGRDAALPAVLLNSHTDVVPAEREKWDYDPFAASLAQVDNEWRLYARGSQDMKCVGMQYLEAISELLKEGWAPERDVVVSFVPDEEIGGVDGLGKLVGSGGPWQNLSIGAGLDEGLPRENAGFNVYYGERQPWWLEIDVVREPGHGALSPDETAGQVLVGIVSRVLAFREEQREGIVPGEFNSLGDTVGVNLVFLDTGIPTDKHPAGFLMNIIPSTARCGFDIRVPPQIPPAKLDEIIAGWVSCPDGDQCPGVTFKFHHRVEIPSVTDRNGAFGAAFMKGLTGAKGAKEGSVAHQGVFFAATDARFVREAGIPSIGFSPMENIPNLLHKHNEYVTVDGYMDGIRTYKHVIRAVAGLWAEPRPDAGGSSPDSEEHEEL